MTTDNRATRSDSNDGALDAMQEAAREVVAPSQVTFRPGDQEFFDAIVGERAPSEWSTSDLLLAANLARCFADIERVTREVASEGDTVTTPKGGIALNPKHSLLETLSRRTVVLMGKLQIHAAARNGRPEGVAPKRAAVAGARAALGRAQAAAEEPDGDDDLLASPGLA